jgi:hypothetical protein
MSAMGARNERTGSQDFFDREFFVEDIRWMVARLLGRTGGGEAPATGDLRIGRVAV